MILEHLISVIGLLVLMGLAYIFSNKRKNIKFRTVIWGVSLQFLFATIILSESFLSFVGMFIFLSLILIYLFEADMGNAGEWQKKLLIGTGTVAVSAALAAALYYLYPFQITTFVLVLALIVFVYSFVRNNGKLQRYSFALFLISGYSIIISKNIYGQVVFGFLSEKVKAFLALTDLGTVFLFGNLVKPEFVPQFGFQFAFAVLPTIIFFSAFMSILYYLGVVQVVIAAMAKFMRWSMRTSGAETISCSANVFVGQTEAPFLVKPFLNDMTISELHAIMVGGFATIAGGVLAGYIRMGISPGHLIAASVMSAPAALVIAKILFPETEHSKTAGDVEMPKIQTSDNLVGAAASGVTDGLKLAANVGAMLIAFLALIGFVDVVLNYFDGIIDGKLLGGMFNEASKEFSGIFPGSLKTAFGTIFRPLAFVMGVPWQDALSVGNLLGTKIAANEFVAYGLLGEHIAAGDLSPRAIIISTYALCGFANFASIGIQIGGIGAIAPGRRADLAKIGVRAMFGGALASWMTATIAGILL